MENSNRNHRVLAGVLTAAMVLSSFSMGTAGAFAAGENGPVAEKSGIELRQAGEPAAVTLTHNAQDLHYVDVANALKESIKTAQTKTSATGTLHIYAATDTTHTTDLAADTTAVVKNAINLTYYYEAIAGDNEAAAVGTADAQIPLTVAVNAVAPQATGVLTYNYENETVSFDDATIEVNTATTFEAATNVAKDAKVDAGATLYYRTKATADYAASATYQTTTAPVKAIVADGSIQYANETVTIPNGAKYKIGTGEEQASTGTAIDVKDSIPANDTANVSVTYWMPATASAFKSDVKTLTLSARPAAPAAPAATDANITSTSVNLTPATGAEYSKDGEAWQDGTEFTGLTANTKYKFHQRFKATASAFKSDEATAEITTKAESVKSSAKSITSVKVDTKDYTPVLAEDGKTYTVTLPEGTTLPTAAGEFVLSVSDKASKGTVTKGEDGSFSVTVTAEDATTTAYTIKFVNAAKAEATATTTTLAVTDKDSKVATGSTYGDALTLTAAVKKGDTDAAAADGTVQFYEGETKLGDAVAIADGKATTTVSTLAAGAHSITAKFVPTDATKVKESASTATAVTVAKKALTAVVTADNEKTYDGKATATVKLTLTGVVDKDTVTATATATLEDVNAGTAKKISSVTGAALAGTTAGNYTLADSEVVTKDITVKVNKASFTVKPVAPVLIKTGEKTAQTLVTDLTEVVSGITGEAGEIKYTPASTVDTANVATNVLTLTPKDAAKGFATGNQTVTVTVSNSNYNNATITVSVTVTDKNIISGATATLEKASQIYTGAEQLPKLTEVKYDTDKTLDLTAKTTTVTAKYIKDDKEVTAVKDAGTYKVVYTITTADSMTVVEASYAITPVELAKFTVATATMVEGNTKFPEFSVKTDVVGTDKADTAANYVYTVTDKDGKTVAAKDVKAGGDYTIKVAATTIPNSNYTVKEGATFTPAKLTVSAKPSGQSYPSGPSTPSEPTVAPVQVTATAASSNATVKAALDKIVAGKDDKSVVATFKKTDKKIAISATTLAGQNVYIYKLIGNTLAVVDNKAEAVGKDGTLTMDNPEAAVTKKLARTADDSTVTYVLIPATEKPPVASVSGTVEVAQGNVVLFDVTSGKSTDAGFAAGNDAVSETRLYTAYKDGKASYGAYGHGKEGQTTGIYVNGVKLFDVKVVKAPYNPILP